MRGIGLVALMAALGMVFAAVTPVMALDVQEIRIGYGVDRTNGTLNNYYFEVGIAGTGINNIVFTDTITPANDWWSLTYDAQDDAWVYSDDSFATYAALTAAHPNPTNLQFYFNNQGGGVFQDQVLLGYSVGAPTMMATISNPTHNETGVEMDPMYTWTSVAGGGQYLGMWIEEDATGDNVYESVPANVNLTSWQPGALAGSQTYYLDVAVLNLHGGQPVNRSTLNSDAFVYTGYFAQGNGVEFTTEVPEPAGIVLVGTALLGLVGWRTRRRMR